MRQLLLCQSHRSVLPLTNFLLIYTWLAIWMGDIGGTTSQWAMRIHQIDGPEFPLCDQQITINWYPRKLLSNDSECPLNGKPEPLNSQPSSNNRWSSIPLFNQTNFTTMFLFIQRIDRKGTFYPFINLHKIPNVYYGLQF